MKKFFLNFLVLIVFINISSTELFNFVGIKNQIKEIQFAKKIAIAYFAGNVLNKLISNKDTIYPILSDSNMFFFKKLKIILESSVYSFKKKILKFKNRQFDSDTHKIKTKLTKMAQGYSNDASNDKDEKHYTCCICHQSAMGKECAGGSNPVVLNCTCHSFYCKQCISRWLKENNPCPTCKKNDVAIIEYTGTDFKKDLVTKIKDTLSNLNTPDNCIYVDPKKKQKKEKLISKKFLAIDKLIQLFLKLFLVSVLKNNLIKTLSIKSNLPEKQKEIFLYKALTSFMTYDWLLLFIYNVMKSVYIIKKHTDNDQNAINNNRANKILILMERVEFQNFLKSISADFLIQLSFIRILKFALAEKIKSIEKPNYAIYDFLIEFFKKQVC